MNRHQPYGCTFSGHNQFREPKISGLNLYNHPRNQARLESLGEKWKSLGKQQLPKKNHQEAEQAENFDVKSWSKFRPEKLSENEYYEQIRPHSPKCFQVMSNGGSKNDKKQDIFSPMASGLNPRRQTGLQQNLKKYQSSIKRCGSLQNYHVDNRNANDDPFNIPLITQRSKGSFLASELHIQPSKNTDLYGQKQFRSKTDKQGDNPSFIDFSLMKDAKQQISRIFNQPSERVIKQCTSRRDLYNLISMCSKSDSVVEEKFSKLIKSKFAGILRAIQSQRKIFERFKFQIRQEVQNVFSFCFNSMISLKKGYQKEIMNLKNTIAEYEKNQTIKRLEPVKEGQSGIQKIKIPQLQIKISSLEDLDSGVHASAQKHKKSKVRAQNENPNQASHQKSTKSKPKFNRKPENAVKPLQLSNQRQNNEKQLKNQKVIIKAQQDFTRQSMLSLMMTGYFGVAGKKDQQKNQQIIENVESPNEADSVQRAKSFQKLFETLETMKSNVYTRNFAQKQFEAYKKQNLKPSKENRENI